MLEFPKMVRGPGGKVRVENAAHERAVLEGRPYSPPKTAPPPIIKGGEYPKKLTHPTTGERLTVNNRDEEFNLRLLVPELQDRKEAEEFAELADDGAETVEIVENLADNPAVVPIEPRRRGRPAGSTNKK